MSGGNVNIGSILAGENSDGTAILSLILYVRGMDQLSRVFSKVESISGVLNVVHANWKSEKL